MNQKQINIGFVIWGVRNGFEVMMASNNAEAEYLKSDVITDNMRQVCNVAPRRFFSIHRNNRFVAATIYHTDYKDVVNRKAYVAITLYLPTTAHFSGNVAETLDKLVDYYLDKQKGNTTSNMFTEDMIRSQFSNLSVEITTGKISFGSRLGFIKYTKVDEVAERLEWLNIDGYKAVFFLPPGGDQTEDHLIGYEQVTGFMQTNRITFDGYDPTYYSVLHNNKPVTGPAGSLIIDGAPGERVFVEEIKTGRSRTYNLSSQNQNHHLRNIFPSLVSDRERNPQKPGKGGIKTKHLVFMALLLIFLSYVLWTTLKGNDEPEQIPVKVENPKKPQTKDPITPPTKDSIEIKQPVVKWFKTKDIFNKEKLEEEEAQKIIQNKKINGISDIKFNKDFDSISFKVDYNHRDSITKIKTRLNNLIVVRKKENPKQIVKPANPKVGGTKRKGRPSK